MGDELSTKWIVMDLALSTIEILDERPTAVIQHPSPSGERSNRLRFNASQATF